MEIFIVIWFVLFFWIIGKGIAQFIENENSPVLTGPATIVDMRRKRITTIAMDITTIRILTTSPLRRKTASVWN